MAADAELSSQILTLADAQYEAMALNTRQTAEDVQALWRQLPTPNVRGFREGALEVIPAITDRITVGQYNSIHLGEQYFRAQAQTQGAKADKGLLKDRLLTPTTNLIHDVDDAIDHGAYMFYQKGVAPLQAQTAGLARMLRHTTTQVHDAGREAVSVLSGATKDIRWEVRKLRMPSCRRCYQIAGSRQRAGAGFKRHKNCDCVGIPFALDLDLTESLGGNAGDAFMYIDGGNPFFGIRVPSSLMHRATPPEFEEAFPHVENFLRDESRLAKLSKYLGVALTLKWAMKNEHVRNLFGRAWFEARSILAATPWGVKVVDHLGLYAAKRLSIDIDRIDWDSFAHPVQVLRGRKVLKEVRDEADHYDDDFADVLEEEGYVYTNTSSSPDSSDGSGTEALPVEDTYLLQAMPTSTPHIYATTPSGFTSSIIEASVSPNTWIKVNTTAGDSYLTKVRLDGTLHPEGFYMPATVPNQWYPVTKSAIDQMALKGQAIVAVTTDDLQAVVDNHTGTNGLLNLIVEALDGPALKSPSAGATIDLTPEKFTLQGPFMDTDISLNLSADDTINAKTVLDHITTVLTPLGTSISIDYDDELLDSLKAWGAFHKSGTASTIKLNTKSPHPAATLAHELMHGALPYPSAMDLDSTASLKTLKSFKALMDKTIKLEPGEDLTFTELWNQYALQYVAHVHPLDKLAKILATDTTTKWFDTETVLSFKPKMDAYLKAQYLHDPSKFTGSHQVADFLDDTGNTHHGLPSPGLPSTGSGAAGKVLPAEGATVHLPVNEFAAVLNQSLELDAEDMPEFFIDDVAALAGNLNSSISNILNGADPGYEVALKSFLNPNMLPGQTHLLMSEAHDGFVAVHHSHVMGKSYLFHIKNGNFDELLPDELTGDMRAMLLTGDITDEETEGYLSELLGQFFEDTLPNIKPVAKAAAPATGLDLPTVLTPGKVSKLTAPDLDRLATERGGAVTSVSSTQALEPDEAFLVMHGSEPGVMFATDNGAGIPITMVYNLHTKVIEPFKFLSSPMKALPLEPEELKDLAKHIDAAKKPQAGDSPHDKLKSAMAYVQNMSKGTKYSSNLGTTADLPGQTYRNATSITDIDPLDVLAYYTGPEGSAVMNSWLRGETSSNNFSGTIEGLVSLDKAMQKAFDEYHITMPDDMVLYRGTSVLSEAMFQPGETVVFPSWTSVTYTKSVAQSFSASKYILEIEVPAGTRAVPGYFDESELILQNKSAFEVVEVNYTDYGDGARVKLRLVDDGSPMTAEQYPPHRKQVIGDFPEAQLTHTHEENSRIAETYFSLAANAGTGTPLFTKYTKLGNYHSYLAINAKEVLKAHKKLNAKPAVPSVVEYQDWEYNEVINILESSSLELPPFAELSSLGTASLEKKLKFIKDKLEDDGGYEQAFYNMEYDGDDVDHFLSIVDSYLAKGVQILDTKKSTGKLQKKTPEPVDIPDETVELTDVVEAPKIFTNLFTSTLAKLAGTTSPDVFFTKTLATLEIFNQPGAAKQPGLGWAAFIGGHADAMNEALTLKAKVAPETTLANKLLKLFFDENATPTKAPTVVYHKVTPVKGAATPSFWKNINPASYEVGDELVEPGWSSHSMTANQALNAGGGASKSSWLYKITLPAGTSVLPGSTMDSELILAPGTAYRVVSVDKKKKVLHIEVIA